MSDAERRELLDGADLLINVSGSLLEPWQYRQVPRLVYIDTDPVVTQTKSDDGAWIARTIVRLIHRGSV